MKSEGAAMIVDIVSNAEEVRSDEVDAVESKPRLLIDDINPDVTLAKLRDILADSYDLYERGSVIRLVHDSIEGGTLAQVVSADDLVRVVHSLCRPYRQRTTLKGKSFEEDARFPRPLAMMYLNWRGGWKLPLFNGIAAAPLLDESGSIRSADGYDRKSGLWCENIPALVGLVSEWPTRREAAAALLLIRDTFKTFCFADAETIYDAYLGVAIVDVGKPPGADESAFLASLLTAVCRPSLHLAPGLLLRAAPLSGAGTGKGLLARCISIIAFGREPHAVTAGSTAEELEKRIASELIQGSSVLFLDNLNDAALKSDLLASAITERPARVRILGSSRMMPLNATAYVILTGNGLKVSEDLARRFIAVDLDAHTEDPEARPFKVDIRTAVTERRREMLAAALTIWRWGRIAGEIKRGLPLGSFEQWGQWVRDPLMALGCQDPVARISEAKGRDGRRHMVAEFFGVWWTSHKGKAVAVRELGEQVLALIDPHGKGRQFQAAYLEKLDGTRIAGFVFTRQFPAGKWGASTYSLTKTEQPETEENNSSSSFSDGKPHRDHRDHRGDQTTNSEAVPPMPPMMPTDSRAHEQTEDESQANGSRSGTWRAKI